MCACVRACVRARVCVVDVLVCRGKYFFFLRFIEDSSILSLQVAKHVGCVSVQRD